jgi:subtilase family serine protease
MAEVSAPPTGYTGVPLVVRNTVAATGGGTGMFEVSFYLSTDATITTSDTYLGKRWVGGLAPGGTDTAETSLTIPATVVPGTWWVGAIADSGNVVVEPNENDNLRASGAVSIKGADLTVVAVGAPQTIATASTIALPVTVKNVGEGGSGTFYLSVYLSSDATITPADSRLAYKVVGPLAPGATAAVTLDVTVGNVAAGTWYLGAFADQYNQVKESSETNNTLAVATTVAGPDLTVTSASGPSSALTGATVVVNDTVAASGGGGASFVYVGYYLSADAVVTTADQLLGSRYVTSLAAGATSAASTSVTIPTTISGGTYHLGVIVDNGGAIPEADEGNNVRDAGVIAITGPDLVATSVSGPASAARGSAVTLSDTVTAAASGGAAPEFYVGLFLSADTTITTADRQVGTRWVGGLGPGAVSSASTSVTVPPDLPPGTYHVGMIVDDLSVWVGDDWEGSYVENNAKESNEGNNAVAGGTIVVQ